MMNLFREHTLPLLMIKSPMIASYKFVLITFQIEGLHGYLARRKGLSFLCVNLVDNLNCGFSLK